MKTLTFAVAGAMLCPALALGMVLGQVDDFQDGTPAGWSGGPDRINQPTAGPAGANDRWLEVVTVSGSGFGSKLGMRNDLQWAGDYAAAGVTGISMDLRNGVAQALDMRIMILSSIGGNFTSANAFSLAADGAWHSAVFGLSASDLTHVGGGSGLLADALGAVNRLLIRNDPDPASGTGPASTPSFPSGSSVGFDNITALPSPLDGDRNADGFVGQADLDIVLAMWGNSGVEITDTRADVNTDDFVGQTDLDFVLSDWGQGTPPTGPVPEPATLTLLALGGLDVLRRRRRTIPSPQVELT